MRSVREWASNGISVKKSILDLFSRFSLRLSLNFFFFPCTLFSSSFPLTAHVHESVLALRDELRQIAANETRPAEQQSKVCRIYEGTERVQDCFACWLAFNCRPVFFHIDIKTKKPGKWKGRCLFFPGVFLFLTMMVQEIFLFSGFVDFWKDSIHSSNDIMNWPLKKLDVSTYFFARFPAISSNSFSSSSLLFVFSSPRNQTNIQTASETRLNRC